MMVSIAVMSVLIAILLPSMQHAQEAARRVACSSNTRQVGLALQAYSYEHRDELPPLFSANSSNASGQNASANSGARAQLAARPGGMNEWGNDSMYVRWASGVGGDGPGIWDGLGHLFPTEYLDEPGVLYCPSHSGRHNFSAYASTWLSKFGTIASNYQYRVPTEQRFLSSMDSRTTFLADGMQSKQDYNHINGNNFLRADLAVLWYHDLNGELLASLPDDVGPVNPSASGRGWDIFDNIVDR